MVIKQPTIGPAAPRARLCSVPAMMCIVSCVAPSAPRKVIPLGTCEAGRNVVDHWSLAAQRPGERNRARDLEHRIDEVWGWPVP